jgi:hypothetical protein
MLTIWGRPSSFNTQKVLWLADELGLTYQHIARVMLPFEESRGRLDPCDLLLRRQVSLRKTNSVSCPMRAAQQGTASV